MWEPPAGFVDMLADADTAAHRGGVQVLEVPRVGRVSARRPGPAGAAWLAMSVKPVERRRGQSEDEAKAVEAQQRHEWLARFVREHLADGEYERILAAMLDGDAPADAVYRIGRAVATWGTARPFGAVVSLAFTSALHWRNLRTRIRSHGIADPMRLPSMHAILDEMETFWLESLHTGNVDKDRYEREQLFDKLYEPDPDDADTAASGEGGASPTTPPPGFSQSEINASFKALSGQLGAR
ncbi:DUF7240 domain-containing protein [Mycolicibacterium pulveris]|uniref:DUF7240 domain-containing protein n=1 Tax=Mycolicibacterium pulveris TaxID=36813 RepID=UPI001F3086A8|nr:hypothetical protein [Mycolicibacterium pulveris]